MCEPSGNTAKSALQQGEGAEMKPLNTVFAAMPTTIFSVMSQLAVKHGSINLGQGFPDEELEGPKAMKHAAASSMYQHSNQYPPSAGLPELRQALAKHSKRCYGLDYRPEGEALVTSGASEALAACMMALANEGDEVVVFDPMYDSYAGVARRLGLRVVPVRLHLPGLTFDAAELAAAFSPRTKLVLLNTPHNPTGKVFTAQELASVAECVLRHNAYAVLDEVYEHLAFPGTPHTSLAQLPGMAARCIRVGSAGKMFSFTAWKVGWALGPAALIAAVAKAHQYLTFTVPPAMQRGVVYGLEDEKEGRPFYESMGKQLEVRRQLLQRRLEAIGFSVLPAQGGYFLLADFRPLLPGGGKDEGDVAFAQRLTEHAGVTVIPASAFYLDQESAPKHLVRFCFCKIDRKLNHACDMLEKYFQAAAQGGST